MELATGMKTSNAHDNFVPVNCEGEDSASTKAKLNIQTKKESFFQAELCMFVISQSWH
jgi:hypothetical protein